jgi:hypothetical protein
MKEPSVTAALVFLCVLCVFVVNRGGSLRAAEGRTSTVGLPARIAHLDLPGSELEVKPLADRRRPIVLRIVNVEPHGDAFRYDLEYYSLEAGSFDLRDYLQRTDRSSAADVPPIPVTVQSVLPPGQIKPHELSPQPLRGLGGYRVLLIGGGVFWVAVLLMILFVGRRKRVVEMAPIRPVTLTDRLRPLVEGAMAGSLAPEKLAELERTLIYWWNRRLHMAEHRPADAVAELRRHAEAGPLLRQLEVWLHQPGTGGTVDVTALLRPYQNVAPDALDQEVKAS